ncbi:hypothetical protein MCBRY_000364 [Methylocystis bryophila]
MPTAPQFRLGTQAEQVLCTGPIKVRGVAKQKTQTLPLLFPQSKTIRCDNPVADGVARCDFEQL